MQISEQKLEKRSGQTKHTMDQNNQMLGCGAHVRKIALPHMRCACGRACGIGFGTVRAL